MQGLIRTWARGFALHLAAAGLAWLCVAAVPAQASLGQSKASVDADVTHLRAHVQATTTATYTVSELTGDGGMVTREFTNGAGTVFAVSWSGPVRPDLQQLFGDYFPRFQADTQARVHVRHPLRADDIDFVVRTGGHPGAMWGFAILPDQVPQGFPMESLQ